MPDKLLGALFLCETVCDVFNVNLGELTRVPKLDTPLAFLISLAGWRDTNDNFSV